MRVISGSARGLKLSSLDGLSTRPTLDRVKEAVFSMLTPYIPCSSVLDLFAGSGGLGIEALSRGCGECTFVDTSKDAIDIIKSNVQKARFADNSTIFRTDFKSFISQSKCKYDLIFLDPPYSMWHDISILSMLLKEGILAEGGIAVVEYDKNTTLDTTGYNVLREKSYGRVSICILGAL